VEGQVIKRKVIRIAQLLIVIMLLQIRGLLVKNVVCSIMQPKIVERMLVKSVDSRITSHLIANDAYLGMWDLNYAQHRLKIRVSFILRSALILGWPKKELALMSSLLLVVL
jgi:hypothetical protein